MIDVKEGDTEAASGPVAEAFDDLGEGLARLALTVPPDVLDNLAPNILGFGNLELVTTIELIALSIDKRTDTLTTNVRLHYQEGSAAGDARDAIDALLTLGCVTQGDAVKGLLDGVSVEASGTVVTIRSKATTSSLRDLIQELEDLSDFGALEAEVQREVAAAIPPQQHPTRVAALPPPNPTPAPGEVREAPSSIPSLVYVPVGEAPTPARLQATTEVLQRRLAALGVLGSGTVNARGQIISAVRPG